MVAVSAAPHHDYPPVRRFGLRAGPDRLERSTRAVFAVGGLAIVLSLAGATWATLHFRETSRWVKPDAGPTQTASADQGNARVATAESLATVSRPFRTANQAFPTVGWNELSLMLRTGLSDDEIIASTAGKQLTVSIGAEQERLLRGMGAGTRLIGFLRAQPVYGAPAYATPGPVYNAPAFAMSGQAAPRPVVASRPVPPPQVVPVVAAMPPPVDYAARDREIGRLKREIDELDERLRQVRVNPNNSRPWWPYYYYSQYSTDQQRRDAYMKKLDDDRNDLRRQKWQLEGR